MFNHSTVSDSELQQIATMAQAIGGEFAEFIEDENEKVSSGQIKRTTYARRLCDLFNVSLSGLAQDTPQDTPQDENEDFEPDETRVKLFSQMNERFSKYDTDANKRVWREDNTVQFTVGNKRERAFRVMRYDSDFVNDFNHDTDYFQDKTLKRIFRVQAIAQVENPKTGIWSYTIIWTRYVGVTTEGECLQISVGSNNISRIQKHDEIREIMRPVEYAIKMASSKRTYTKKNTEHIALYTENEFRYWESTKAIHRQESATQSAPTTNAIIK